MEKGVIDFTLNIIMTNINSVSSLFPAGYWLFYSFYKRKPSELYWSFV